MTPTTAAADHATMKHVRLTTRHNPTDELDDFYAVGKLRRDLQVHSPVEIDPENPFSETQRDAKQNLYFEFATENPDSVERVLRDHGHADRVTMAVLGDVGLVCANCGFFAGFVTKCPNCGHRDINPCPHCGQEVARERYEPVFGDLHNCPQCHKRVRIHFNPDLCNADGSYNQPIVVVETAGV